MAHLEVAQPTLARSNEATSCYSSSSPAAASSTNASSNSQSILATILEDQLENDHVLLDNEENVAPAPPQNNLGVRRSN